MRKSTSEKFARQLAVFSFENHNVRTAIDPETGEQVWSVIDVVGALTGSENPNNYWKVLKNRLNTEGNQTVTFCNRLKLVATDGRRRSTDVANMEQILRIIESIPSPKAEPFKQWLARVGAERLEEERDPSKAVERAIRSYKRMGLDDQHIKTHLLATQKRNKITHSWAQAGITDQRDYAKLTSSMYTWSDFDAKEYKQYKEIDMKENLRKHMTNEELTAVMVAEETAYNISVAENPTSYEEVMDIAMVGVEAARAVRNITEKRLGRSIVSKKNARDFKAIAELKRKGLLPPNASFV